MISHLPVLTYNPCLVESFICVHIHICIHIYLYNKIFSEAMKMLFKNDW